MSEQLAIIKEPKFVIHDRTDRPCFYFSTYTTEHSAASQYIQVDDPSFEGLFAVSKGDVKNLDGKPCWVEVGGGMIKFLRVAEI